jgi:diguanylate cyclase (GGDEF)-like protein
VLGNHFRSGDLRARVGGDEFVVALAGETPSSAVSVLSRALEEFCRVEFDSGSGMRFGATFTAGVAAAPEDGSSRDALLRAADRRLYVAKRAGKCQISASQ